MLDLTSTILPQLYAHRLPGLDLADGLVFPFYDGLSILNIPSTLCDLLQVPPIASPSLHPAILNALGNHYRRVILVLMDALAWHRLQRWMNDGTAPIWSQLAFNGLLAPLTSITPSTTSAALTSLWTGCSPAEHGITGYEMWLKEYGVVANTILHAPITFNGDVGSLERAGFNPEKFLNQRTLGTHLAANGVKTYALQHKSIAQSGLSRMLFKDVDVQIFHTASDLWINLRHLLEKQHHQRMFCWVYWSEVDHFAHFYGPDDERTVAEFASFSQAMQQFFLERLSPAAREDTLLILTADHGSIFTPIDSHYDLRNHPSLVQRLHIYPTGEHRLAYLYPRPGQLEAVREYVERAWPDQFCLLRSTEALKYGLYGPGLAHSAMLDRLGDLVMVGLKDAYLWWADKENRLVGRHGGMSAEEMLVPLLAARL